MKKRILLGLIGLLSSMFLVSAVYADTIVYDNGAVIHSTGKEFTQYIVTQDFILSEAATVNGLRFWGFEEVSNSGYQGSITYFFYDDDNGVPGVELVSNTVTVNPVDTGITWKFGGAWMDEYFFDFTIPAFNAAAATVYHLGLHNGPMDYITREDFYWEDTTPNGTYPIIWNLFHPEYDWHYYNHPYEQTFQLLGTAAPTPDPTPTPEPATILLVGFGLMGLASVRRKV